VCGTAIDDPILQPANLPHAWDDVKDTFKKLIVRNKMTTSQIDSFNTLRDNIEQRWQNACPTCKTFVIAKDAIIIPTGKQQSQLNAAASNEHLVLDQTNCTTATTGATATTNTHPHKSSSSSSSTRSRNGAAIKELAPQTKKNHIKTKLTNHLNESFDKWPLHTVVAGLWTQPLPSIDNPLALEPTNEHMLIAREEHIRLAQRHLTNKPIKQKKTQSQIATTITAEMIVAVWIRGNVYSSYPFFIGYVTDASYQGDHNLCRVEWYDTTAITDKQKEHIKHAKQYMNEADYTAWIGSIQAEKAKDADTQKYSKVKRGKAKSSTKSKSKTKDRKRKSSTGTRVDDSEPDDDIPLSSIRPNTLSQSDATSGTSSSSKDELILIIHKNQWVLIHI
jgi:hypothetical protein